MTPKHFGIAGISETPYPFALCNIGFGLVAAATSRSAGAAAGISFFFLMPQLFLGTFVGTALSSTARSAGRFLPAFYVTDA